MRLKDHGSPRRGTGFVSHTKPLTEGGLPPESVTPLPYREGLGLGGCLFASFSAPEKVREITYEGGSRVVGKIHMRKDLFLS